MLAFRQVGKASCKVIAALCRPAAQPMTRQFSTQPIKVDFPKEVITPEIEKTVTLGTANSKEIYQHKVGLAVKKFQIHKSDTGSASVQSRSPVVFRTSAFFVLIVPFHPNSVATMTEKVLNLTRHFAEHRKDKHGNRGFQVGKQPACSVRKRSRLRSVFAPAELR
jgi:ribosomal protein S15P/S13E